MRRLFSDILVTIHEGRNRQVRRMFDAIGHKVLLLRRVRFGVLYLGDLKRGEWRELTPEEVAELKNSKLTRLKPPRSEEGSLRGNPPQAGFGAAAPS